MKEFIEKYQNDKNAKIMKYAILLETRLSKNIPNFNFQMMQFDEQIQQFEEIVK